jgi:hypothetical protein
MLYDTTLANTISNFYVCTDAALNGSTIVSGQSPTLGTTWTAIRNGSVNSAFFSTYVLLFAKVSVKYFGRSDAESGYFGAGITVSSVNALTVDNSASVFDYVTKSVNGKISYLSEGLNCIYTVKLYIYF